MFTWDSRQEKLLELGLWDLYQSLQIAARCDSSATALTDCNWDKLGAFLSQRLRDLQEALGRYAEILLEWHKAFHLLGQQNEKDFVSLHLLDSISGAMLLEGANCLHQGHLQIVDVGSGLGLPGIPLALYFNLCRNSRDQQNQDRSLQLFLVEPAARRANILRSMIAELGLLEVVQVCQHPVEEWNKWQGLNDRQFSSTNTQRIVTCRAFRTLNKKNWKQLLKPLEGTEELAKGVLLYKGGWELAEKELANLKLIAQVKNIFTLPQCSHQRSLFYLEV